jgi:hypothetical protein
LTVGAVLATGIVPLAFQTTRENRELLEDLARVVIVRAKPFSGHHWIKAHQNRSARK